MRKVLVFATVAGLVALGAGCSSSGGGSEDRALAKRVVLKKSDLPDGWAAGPNQEGNVGLPECRGVDRANDLADKGPKALSRNLSDPSDQSGVRQVQNTIYVFPNAGAANGYFAAYTADTAVACFEAIGETVSVQLGGGIPVSVQQPTAEVQGADAVVEYKIVVGPSGDETQSLIQNILVVRVGRIVAGFSASNFGGNFPQGTAALTAVMGRIGKATQ
jgi:hypothetical protein